MKSRLFMRTVGLCVAVCAYPLFAFGATETNNVMDHPLLTLPDLQAAVSKMVRQPDTYNTLFGVLTNRLAEAGQTNAYLQFLRDLNVKFKVFGTDHEGDGTVLGLEYNLNKAIVGRTVPGENPLGMSLAFHAKGNIAFDKDKNPEDFLETALKFHFFQSRGGWDPQMVEDIPEDRTKLAPLQILTSELQKKNKLNFTEAQRRKDPDWQNFFNYLNSHLRTQLFWDAAGNFALESNQDFTDKQWAYGAQVGVVPRAWQPDSWLARYNILDWPFALIRYVTDVDPKITPSGQALPSLLVGLDMIDPFDNDTRRAIDPDDDAYPRFRGEVAFKTGVGAFLQKPVWFSLSYRYFRELDSSSALHAAKLDEHSYVAASLEFLDGFSFTYSNGKLPLDRRSDQVFALGYKLNF